MLRRFWRAVYLDALHRRAQRSTIVPPAAHIMVFAPHPDDETLACGGLIERAVRASHRVRIVFMTGGVARRAEALAATAVLGVPASGVTFFDFPDGNVSDHRYEAVHRAATLLRAERPKQVFLPYRKDLHPDHVATAEIVLAALAAAHSDADAYEYPVWLYACWPLIDRHAAADTPGTGRATSARLLRRTVVSGARLFAQFGHVVPLERSSAERKAAALACYRSQIVPNAASHTLGDLSGGEFVALFARDHELFRAVAPARQRRMVRSAVSQVPLRPEARSR
jgi:LmbE family N-acetylglucosaminyl deacetylase